MYICIYTLYLHLVDPNTSLEGKYLKSEIIPQTLTFRVYLHPQTYFAYIYIYMYIYVLIGGLEHFLFFHNIWDNLSHWGGWNHQRKSARSGRLWPPPRCSHQRCAGKKLGLKYPAMHQQKTGHPWGFHDFMDRRWGSTYLWWGSIPNKTR